MIRVFGHMTEELLNTVPVGDYFVYASFGYRVGLRVSPQHMIPMPGSGYKTREEAVTAAEHYSERTEFALRTVKPLEMPVFTEPPQTSSEFAPPADMKNVLAAGKGKPHGHSVGGFTATWHDNYIRRVEQDHWQCYDEVMQPMGMPHMWYIDAVMALDEYARTLEPGKLGPVSEPAVPRTGQVSRIGDHDPDTRLRLTRESDNDIIVEVLAKDWHGDSEHGVMQFCTHQGGGKSPNTLKALAALMAAMEKDNEENKQ